MAKFAGRRRVLPEQVLDAFKYEIAGELGFMDRLEAVGWGDMTSQECGAVGGRIGGRVVRVMIRHAEQELARPGHPV
ncbi:MAG: alpha/beta-type small acid-soluble spore protein [Bacillota bacterium]